MKTEKEFDSLFFERNIKKASTAILYKNIFVSNEFFDTQKLTNSKRVSFYHENIEYNGFVQDNRSAKRIVLILSDERDVSFLNKLNVLIKDESIIVIVSQRDEKGKYFYGIRERYQIPLWIDYIKNNISDKLPVYIFGAGIGGITALMCCGMKLSPQVHGFIADSVCASPGEFIKDSLKTRFGNEKGSVYADRLDRHLMKNHNFSMYDYCINESMKTCNRPVLFFRGQKDKIASSSMMNSYNACKTEKEIVTFKNAGYLRGMNTDADRYLEKLEEFFYKNDDVEFSSEVRINYPKKTMYQMVETAAKRLPDDPAYNFKGSITSYNEMMKRIDKAAKAFVSYGIGEGDVVTLCMPNLPQSVDCLYALNKIGATASLIHPLSAENEIIYYLNLSKSKMILTPDLFYEKVAAAVKNSRYNAEILVARIQDELNPFLRTLYNIKKGKDYKSFPDERGGKLWSEFVNSGAENSILPKIRYDKNRTAVILYSGGTTGEPKGIRLSDLNFNALAMQARVAMECEFSRGLKNLSAMPIFHGFGLGIGIHTVLINNACCVLMPQVNTKEYSKTLLKDKPNFIAGVPTIFKMLIESENLKGKDLSFLKGMFVGGDSMPVPLKKDVDKFLKEHGATIQVREGYGLTECVTASCLTPKDTYKENSIGLPFPDTRYKIVRPDTEEEVPTGNEGEIVISGPTVMLGYLDSDEETAKVLKTHSDGRVWLHTGDLGFIDEDGYVYYKQRIKRLIVSSGYNIYPSQVEKAIESHNDVDYCCVIGVPDEFKIEKIKAFIVLKNGVTGDDRKKKEILEHCRKHIASYELPKEIEFRKELPKTLVGKVAYRKLEEEERAAG